MKTRELRALLKAKQCRLAGTEGSHEKWEAPGGHSTIIKAAVTEQAPGTLREIQSHLAPEFGDTWIKDGRK
jgi:hypothetical protein